MFNNEFNGHVDSINRFEVLGWALNSEKSGEPVEVELYVDGTCVDTILADIPCPDLKVMDIENCNHGFRFKIEGTGVSSVQLGSAKVKIKDACEFLKSIDYYDTFSSVPAELYQSRFGGNWIDRVDAEKLLAEKLKRGVISEKLAELLRYWHKNGYVILEKAIPEEIIDQINRDIDNIWAGNLKGLKIETFYPDNLRKIIDADVKYRSGATKLLDLHAVSKAAQQAVLSKPIFEFLNAVFEAAPWGFQSLTFWHGSEQSIHKDTAYVRIHPPMNLAASWIALEDIEEGTGELQYYEGSHKSPDYLFGGINKWIDSNEHQHEDFLASLHRDAQKYKQKLIKFFPKKGDVLIWHADLAHGGAKITKPGATRKSLVTHYCGLNATPYYIDPEKVNRINVNGGYLSSEYSQICECKTDSLSFLIGLFKNALRTFL
jgi:hypothetical protein